MPELPDEAYEIEVTPEMIQAGADAYWSLDVEDIGSLELVRAVYRAMELARLMRIGR